MARAGYRTILLEKNSAVGGRAQFAQDSNFKFNLGPSWYVMPDIYEDFFRDFGQSPEDHYTLTKLSPAFRSFTGSSKIDALELGHMAESLEAIKPGDGIGIKRLVNRSKIIYSNFKLNLMAREWSGLKSYLKPSVLTSLSGLSRGTLSSRSSKLVGSAEARGLIGGLSNLLGVDAKRLPAMYSYLPYTVLEQGVWYPGGGFNSVISGFKSLAQQLGVEIYEGYQVEKIEVQYGLASAVSIKGLGQRIPADIVISASDYIGTELMLDSEHHSYPDKYWSNKKYSPSAIIVSLGLNTKVPELLHHNTFSAPNSITEEDFLTSKVWPATLGAFQVTCPSLTDPSLAPEGGEVLTISIPIPAGLNAEEDAVQSLIAQAIARIKEATTFDVSPHVVTQHVVSSLYFKEMFNTPGGSTHGLALTKGQILHKRPRIKSKKLSNLFFAGQDTSPGPGAPFAITSGKIAAYSALGKRF